MNAEATSAANRSKLEGAGCHVVGSYEAGEVVLLSAVVVADFAS